MSSMKGNFDSDFVTSSSILDASRGGLRGFDEIDTLIHDPIRCGYLLAYALSQYSSENITFVIELDKFKYQFSIDPNSWGKKSWQELDKITGIGSRSPDDDRSINEIIASTFSKIGKPEGQSPETAEWPSLLVTKAAIEATIVAIWESFISDAAQSQVCAPSAVIRNTLRRIDLHYLYGPQIFDEILLEALKTVKRDVLPRFMISPLWFELEQRIKCLNPLPYASALVVPSPTKSKVANPKYNLEAEDALKLEEFVTDRVLYDSFHAYLESIMSKENLLCARMINIYKEALVRNDLSAAKDYSWQIFMFFVAHGSALEIGLSDRSRRNVMYSLATPDMNTFDKAEKVVLHDLRETFGRYQRSAAFTSLIPLIEQKRATYLKRLKEKESRTKALNSSESLSCFGLTTK